MMGHKADTCRTEARTLRSAKLSGEISVGKILEELEKVNSAWRSLVELEFFLNLTDKEAADVLEVKLRTA